MVHKNRKIKLRRPCAMRCSTLRLQCFGQTCVATCSAVPVARAAPAIMRLAQVSDLHLWTHAEDARTTRYLANSAEHPNAADNVGSFNAVLDDIMRYSSAEHVDRLVITGDIAQDEQRETYELLRHLLEERGWLAKTLLIPGNHEQRKHTQARTFQIGQPHTAHYC
jgi:predicted MPP superfamily phosphohydrolase